MSTVYDTSAEGSKDIITWEESIASLLQEKMQTTRRRRQEDSDAPFLVALVGIPGSGKSTSAHILSALLSTRDIPNTIVPVDGYHYPLSTLQSFPKAQDVIYRRGAPDTFDTSLLVRDLDLILHSKETFVSIPGFNHDVGDPEPNSHAFDRKSHQLVLCEGLYLLHDDHGWEDLPPFDFSIYIHSDIDKAVERLKVRNQCIPGYTVEEIKERCEAVDRVNAVLVEKSKEFADCIVESAAPTSIVLTIQ